MSVIEHGNGYFRAGIGLQLLGILCLNACGPCWGMLCSISCGVESDEYAYLEPGRSFLKEEDRGGRGISSGVSHIDYNWAADFKEEDEHGMDTQWHIRSLLPHAVYRLRFYMTALIGLWWIEFRKL